MHFSLMSIPSVEYPAEGFRRNELNTSNIRDLYGIVSFRMHLCLVRRALIWQDVPETHKKGPCDLSC